MRRVVFYIVLFVLCVSCEYQFDVKSSDESSKLYVESIAGLEDDLSYMKVMKTTPIGSTRQNGEDYLLQWKILSFDGSEVSMYKTEGQPFYQYPEIDDKISEMSLKMKAEGMKDITAYTEVPAKPVLDIRYEILSDRILWKLNLSGASNYAFALYYKTEGEGGTFEGTWEFADIYSDTDGMSLLEMLTTSLKTVSWETYYHSYKMVLLRGEELENGGFSFSSNNGGWEYKLVVYSLSDSAYGYLNALYNQDNNYLGMLGLSPPNFAYSNIEGGYGVFGAVRKTQMLINIESTP